MYCQKYLKWSTEDSYPVLLDIKLCWKTVFTHSQRHNSELIPVIIILQTITYIY